jgi:hypothetical protein
VSWDCGTVSQDYFSSSDARQSQTAQIQAEMEKTKGVMHDTIGQALARGENLDRLVEKTDDLRCVTVRIGSPVIVNDDATHRSEFAGA